MKKIIHKIRLQPPEFRMMVAVVLAVVLTVIIGAFWLATLSSGPTQEESTNAPSPFSTLVSSVKTIISSSKPATPDASSGNTVQVIDASKQ